MRETAYAATLLDSIVPTHDPLLARAVTDGLLKAVTAGPLRYAPQIRARIGSRALHAWTVNGPPALTEHWDSMTTPPAIALEVKRAHGKTASNATNWHRRATLRARYRTHGADDDISQLVYDAYLANTNPALDAPHYDSDCGGTANNCGDSEDRWRVDGMTGKHYPVVHQADTYAATIRWIPTGLAASSPRDFAYLLISPSDESTRKFFTGLVSQAIWSVASLPLALNYWVARQDDVSELRALVAATRSFLPAETAGP